VITLDDWAEIRRLYASGGHSKRELAKRLGVSRGTVDRALQADRVPRYERALTGSSFDEVAPAVRKLLSDSSRMPSPALAERVGWSGSSSLFRLRVAAIRPEYLPPDPADRIDHQPGVQVQCDLWFPHQAIPLGHDQHGMPPVLVMTSTFSGNIQALMLPSRTTPDLLGGMWQLLQQAGAVPERLVWDNETGIGRRKLTEPAAAFAGTLGTKIVLLPPRDPESKGMVERMNQFFRSRFMPGRSFASPADFNNQLVDWLPVANARHSRSRRGKPAELVGRDRAAMRALSPVPPEVLFRNTVRLPRDYYVRVFTNDYSVSPGMIGRIVDVTADLHQVTVTHDGTVIAVHQREWARQLIVTDPAHVAEAAVLRQAFKQVRGYRPLEAVETRDLASYDDLFGTGQVA
jgi:transposase